jgi:hypothetical protein
MPGDRFGRSWARSSSGEKRSPADSDEPRYKGKLFHIGVGNAYAGWRVVLLVDGLDVQVIGFDCSPLRHLSIDPTVDYQRTISALRPVTWVDTGSTMSCQIAPRCLARSHIERKTGFEPATLTLARCCDWSLESWVVHWTWVSVQSSSTPLSGNPPRSRRVY